MTIIDRFCNITPCEVEAPLEEHFALMKELDESMPLNQICQYIYEQWDLEKHNRDLIVLMYSMLIWHSSAHDLEVSRFFKNWQLSNDHKLVSINTSPVLGWAPMKNWQETYDGMKTLKLKHPEFSKDCDWWIETAHNNIAQQNPSSWISKVFSKLNLTK